MEPWDGAALICLRQENNPYVLRLDLDQDNKKIRPRSTCKAMSVPTLDTMLTIQNYIFPSLPPANIPINADASQILGFSSSGYICFVIMRKALKSRNNDIQPSREIRFAAFILADAKDINVSRIRSLQFHDLLWNGSETRINFLIPYRDTVCSFQFTRSPLYALHKDNQDKPNRSSFFLGESERAIMGVFQKVLPPSIIGWDGW